MPAAPQAQARALEESKAAFQREAVERKRLHNLVQELQGNIRVYVRVKPLDAEEAEVGVAACVEVREGRRVLCEQGGQSKAFEFDKAFGPAAGQAEIFEDISALVTSALDGYNVCTFAYGQTGAGKTHTMEGTKEDPGINFRTVAELFRCIKEERGADYTYVIRASIVEIYNEVVRDLLSEEGSRDAELVKVRPTPSAPLPLFFLKHAPLPLRRDPESHSLRARWTSPHRSRSSPSWPRASKCARRAATT
mmetsp:Transcript_10105/g.32719  ORF Transcript_10105/g.32719 Transcript_10105/m.32719 type:complete len:250 (-) Transcript_10105:739-1488(-)